MTQTNPIQVIHKFPLAIAMRQTLSVPEGGEIISLQNQYDLPTMWIKHIKGAKLKKQDFLLIATGESFTDQLETGDELTFVGSCLLYSGSQVYHIYMVQPTIHKLFKKLLLETMEKGDLE